MARISYIPLASSVRAELTKQLAKVFIQQKTTVDMNKLLVDLFGEEEKVMLMKRIAIIGMLLKECSAYEIHNTLHVSTDTVKIYRKKLAMGECAHIETFFEKKKESAEFWNTLEVLLRGGMPPRGRGRWSSTYKRLNSR